MGCERIRVLLVEDNPGDARLIHWMLRETGEVRFELTEADRLVAAQRLLAEDEFSVVLLDLSLPDSQGLETFRAVHGSFPRVPVVVLSGLADETVAVQAVHEGAQDYLVKGQVLDRHLVHALRYAVGRHQWQVLRDLEVIIPPEEVEALRRVQRRLLPVGPPACDGIEMYGASVPAGAAGGDYFDYLTPCDGEVGVVVGDVAGKGPGPALLMALTRAYLRAHSEGQEDPGRVLARTNRALAADVPAGYFVTLLFAYFDRGRRRLRYANAGHCTGHVLGRDGSVRACLYSTGLPLGIEADGAFSTGPEVPLEPGDFLLLVTDGILEAQAPSRERFGTQRALAVARENRHRPAREVVDSLFAAARRFAGSESLHDDGTAIVVKVV
jgi:serine phosphatase RsbU (regulator of sigma subunit)